MSEDIETALEKEITRGDCKNCPKLYKKWGFINYCDVTEKRIGSGNEYCELEEQSHE